MRQFTLRLLSDVQRPTVKLNDFFRIRGLIDTGAVLPVWVSNEELLRKIGGIPVAANQPFGGFGGMTTGTLYKIPYFRCGDLIFPDLPIIASPMNLPCQMILSAPMFDNLIYEIDSYNHRFNVSVPDTESMVRNLRIEDKDGILHVLCSGVAGEV